MKIQTQYRALIKHVASAVTAAIALTAIAGISSASVMPSATAHVFTHPPTSGDCTACHPKPKRRH